MDRKIFFPLSIWLGFPWYVIFWRNWFSVCYYLRKSFDVCVYNLVHVHSLFVEDLVGEMKHKMGKRGNNWTIRWSPNGPINKIMCSLWPYGKMQFLFILVVRDLKDTWFEKYRKGWLTKFFVTVFLVVCIKCCIANIWKRIKEKANKITKLILI